MNEYEIEKIINEMKDLQDIRSEYQKTYFLLQQHRWNELSNHIQEVANKHQIEAKIHNAINHYQPSTIEQNAINCMAFLENLFKSKLGTDVMDITKYLMK